MGVVKNMCLLALQPLVDGLIGAGGSEAGGDAGVGALAERFRTNRSQFACVLHQAGEHAWQALEIALVGEALWEQVQTSLRRNADEMCRRHLRCFLDTVPLVELSGHGSEIRQHCLDELRAARAEGLLTLVDFDPDELARKVRDYLEATASQGRAALEGQILDQMAGEFRHTNFPALALLLSIRPAEGHHILTSAVRFFLRKAVEADPESAALWMLSPPEPSEQDAGLAALTEALAISGPILEDILREVRVVVTGPRSTELNIKTALSQQELQVLEIGQGVTRLLEKKQMAHRHVRPTDSLSLGEESERQLARELVTQFRTLPEDQQQIVPALLNGVGLLETALGEFDEARRDFEKVSALSADPEAQAEAHYNAYWAALEHRRWDEALASLRQAVYLSPDRFAPFPSAKYEVERILGAGGTGVAFLCRNRHSGSRVVVKALRVDSLERDVAEVFREVRVLEELDHSAIIRFRDCDYVRGDRQRPFLVTDYFEGQTLADYVRQHGKLTPADALVLLRQMAEALQAAHVRSIWHRDLNPANLLVRRDGAHWEVKLVDFGLALKLSVIHATIGNPIVRTNTALGRSVSSMMNYAAPEQMGLVDGAAPGPASDVYAFGKIALFALLGNPDPDEDEKGTLPEAWRKLLARCTAPNSAKRPASFSAVLENLPLAAAPAATPAAPPATPKPAGAATEAAPTPPKDAAVFYDRGIAHVGKGAYDRAIVEFSQAIKLNPQMALAYFHRGDVYRLKGEHDRAITDFTQTLRIDPKYVPAYISRGRVYRHKGDYDRAIADFTRVLRIDPKHADAFNNRGNAHAEKGEYDKAVADYTEALRLDPNLVLAYINRALAHAKKGEHAAVLADCTHALRLNPKLPTAYFIRGTTYANKGDYDQAIADFTRVLRLDPKHAAAHNDRGLALANKGDYERAILDYTKALQLDPKLSRAYMNRAIAYRLKGDYDRAILEFTRLFRLYPKNAAAYTNRGLAYLAKRDYDRAIADFTEALWIDPNYKEAYERRLEAVRTKSEGNKAGAKTAEKAGVKTPDKTAEKAGVKTPDKAGAKAPEKAGTERKPPETVSPEERERRQSLAAALFSRGQMHFDADRYDRAIADFTEALKFDAEDAMIYYQRGLSHAAQDDHDQALADFAQAIRLNPKLADAYYHRGVAYRLKGNYARAVADFTDAIRLKPKFALAYRTRSLAYAALGEQDKAKADAEEAVRLDPTLAKK